MTSNATNRFELATLPEIFGWGRRRFIIPEYQRSYSWEAKHRADLLEDIENIAHARVARADASGAARHYTGTIVAASEGRTDDDTACEIVDGQQRLTSLILLVNEILTVHGLGDAVVAAPDGAVRVREILIARNEGAGRTERPLTLNQETREYFEVALLDGRPQQLDAQTKGHLNLADARAQFNAWAKSLGQEGALSPAAALEAVMSGLGFLFYLPRQSAETGCRVPALQVDTLG